MTAMPQMVALYQRHGRRCRGRDRRGRAVPFRVSEHALVPLVVTIIGALIGSISLSGSVIAWAKLDGRINGTWRFSWPAGDERQRSGIVATLAPWPVHRLRCPRPCAAVDDCGLLRAGADLRRADDDADRRRRHAGGDLPVQRAHRPCRRLRRLRAAEPGADHRRHGGRRGGHLPDPAHGQGHEPLGQSNVLFSNFGAAAGEEQGEIKGSHEADRGRRRRHQHALRWPSQGHHRPGLRPGRGAGPAQALREFVRSSARTPASK